MSIDLQPTNTIPVEGETDCQWSEMGSGKLKSPRAASLQTAWQILLSSDWRTQTSQSASKRSTFMDKRALGAVQQIQREEGVKTQETISFEFI